MTQAERDKIRAYWESGMSLAQIRAVMGVGNEELLRELQELGVGKRPTAAERIVAMFEGGNKNSRKIADEIGVSQRTVYNALYEKGLRIGGKTRTYVHCRKTHLIARDLESGMRQSDIARKHGVSRQYVSQVAQKVKAGLI